jgi:hypothetical protein
LERERERERKREAALLLDYEKTSDEGRKTLSVVYVTTEKLS